MALIESRSMSDGVVADDGMKDLAESRAVHGIASVHAHDFYPRIRGHKCRCNDARQGHDDFFFRLGMIAESQNKSNCCVNFSASCFE